MSWEEWGRHDAAALATRVRRKQVTARELARQVARAVELLNPRLAAVLEVFEDVVRKPDTDRPNKDGALLPGMYAQLNLSSKRVNPPLVIPSEALVVRSDGTLVAMLGPDQTVHLQKISVGRDYGDRLEVISGLREGDTIVLNPGDLAREGVKVEPVPATPKPAAKT